MFRVIGAAVVAMLLAVGVGVLVALLIDPKLRRQTEAAFKRFFP